MEEALTASKFDIMSIMNIGLGNFEKIQKDSIVRKYGYYAGGYKRFEITKELFERIKELRNKIIKQTKCNLELPNFSSLMPLSYSFTARLTCHYINS